MLKPYWVEIAAVMLVVLALIVRLYWMQFEGYSFDTYVNRTWGLSALKYGLIDSYSQQLHENMLPNYPPLSILIFQYMSGFANMLQLMFSISASVLQNVVIKLPSLVADVVASGVLYYYLRSRLQSSIALAVAALYFAHPGVMYNAAYWGQTDSIFTMFIVCTVVALFSKRFGLAGVLAAAAVLSKFQAVVFFPLFALFALFYKGALRKSLIWFCIVFLAACLPFVVFGQTNALLSVYTDAVGFYSGTSYNAYNIWWLLYGDVQPQDTALIFSFVSHRLVGLVLFSIVYVISMMLFIREQRIPHSKLSKELVFFMSLSMVAAGFFLFTTQMHERYLFPFMALGLPLIVTMPRFIGPYVLLSLGYLWNLLGVLPYGPLDQAVYNQFPGWDLAMASMMLGAFIWFTVVAFSEFVRPQVLTRSRRSR